MTNDLSSKFDLRHAATDRPSIVRVGERRFFAIDGRGLPESSGYGLAADALRHASRVLGVRLAHELNREYRASPLETVWWPSAALADRDLADAFGDRSAWMWEQVIEIPDPASPEDIDQAIAETRQAHGRAEPLLRLATRVEGRAVQILHPGHGRSEQATLRLLLDFASANGLTAVGTVHEIRLSERPDARSDDARAIVRLPIADS